MAKLNAADRKKLLKSDFGLPMKDGPEGGSKSKYPMPDKSHAANAKARATQQFEKGNLSAAQKARIDAKANKILKGKTK